MSNVLHRLIYHSRNRMIGPAEEVAASIESILTTSRRNNSAAGVTGALMFNNGCFAQILEGSADAVEQTFDRIQMDERHGEVTLLGVAITEERAFDNWSMAFVGRSVNDAARYAQIAEASGFESARMTREEIFEALHRLTLEHEVY